MMSNCSLVVFNGGCLRLLRGEGLKHQHLDSAGAPPARSGQTSGADFSLATDAEVKVATRIQAATPG